MVWLDILSIVCLWFQCCIQVTQVKSTEDRTEEDVMELRIIVAVTNDESLREFIVQG